MSKIVLFENKTDCCGCGACVNKCPKGAINMDTDEYGFVYPAIDDEKCVECGVCKTVCGYQNLPECHSPKQVYAAASKDDDLLRKSASGGAFAVFAGNIIDNGGVVYGSALVNENDKLYPKHIRIDSKKDIIKLQGSKYVQSDISFTYKDAEKNLKEGKQVLFSGTPCQIAGLKAFLKKEYENLITVDIICHGVPGGKFFEDFINSYEKTLGGRIKEFYFRDKSKGQGMITRAVYNDVNGKVKEKVCPGGLLSYVSLFLKSHTYRENCYSCPFASEARVSDITIGDYWGFHQEHPSFDKSIDLTNSKGISCILINSAKGAEFMKDCGEVFITLASDFEKVDRHNEQLHSPSRQSSLREIILEKYRNEGYEGVEKYYKSHFMKDKIKTCIAHAAPKGFKRTIIRLIGRLKSK